MIDYALWLLVVTLVQLSLLTLWFDSEILSPVLQYCLRQKAKNPRYFKWFIFSVLTCPMCFGYWLAWGSAAIFSFFPFFPVKGIGVGETIALIFFTGLAVAILSRLIDGFMPEPVNQKLLIVDLEEKEKEPELVDVAESESMEQGENNGD